MRKEWLLILLICLAGCIPKGFIITEETAEDVSECPQLTIESSLDPAPAKEITTITIVSDKLLINSPTVIITQHYEKRGTDITKSMETTDQMTWQGTYTVKPGYEGKALIEVLNALDEDGNKGYGTASFEVILPEEGAEETESDQEVEYEEVIWHDIRGEYGETGAAQAPMLTPQMISNNVSCIDGDDKRVWLGTNYGIGQYDRLTQGWMGFLNKKGGMGNSIRCLAIDDDIIWFGSQGDGLFRYQDSTGKWLAFPADNKCPDPNINDILIVNNTVWAATNKGLSKYDKLSKQWISYTLQTTYNQLISEKITKIAWLYPCLWVGTDKGLMSYDPLSDVWQDQTGICSKGITCLFMDKNDLWIGTLDNGIIQYNTTDNGTKTYTTANGLCSNSILSLKADTSHVFVGHSGGISMLDKSNDTWMSFTHTKIGDIIRPLDDIQAVYFENDNPWIGMNTGLVDISQSQLMEIIQPTIIELNPAPDTVLSTAYLKITAKYEDNINGSGIDPLATLLWVDGVQVYGTVTAQEIYYKPISPLTEGEHSLEIQVADKCGNIAARKNTFSITLPKLSYKLLVSRAYVKPGGEISVTIEASEELQGTPTASLSFADSRMLFIAGTSKVAAPSIMEDGTLAGTSTVFGSWTTIDRKKWRGTTIVPINALGMGTVTVENLKDIHGREPKAEDSPAARIKAVIKDDGSGIIAPQIPRITSLATSAIASVTTNIITGTATPGSFVNLMVDGKTVRTVMANEAGTFTFKNISNILLKAGTAATTITTSATDRTRIASEVSETVATPNLLVDFPRLAGNILKVRGVASQMIGTISGNLVYDQGSVTLRMTVGSGSMGWVGTASIPSGIEGMMGTLTIFGTDSRVLFTGVLMIDTVPPGTPTIAANRTSIGGWIIYGTATGANLVELWSGQRLYGTTIPRDSGRFAFKADPLMIPSGTTTLWAVSMDNAGNRTTSEVVVIYPPLRISAKLPQFAGKMFEVYVANQAISTISGYVSYGIGSVALNMAIVNTDVIGGMGGWVGTASIPDGIEGMGTLTIFATDTCNQQATFTSMLNIDTIPPGTPTIAATYIAITSTTPAGWLVYGTATDAVVVRLWGNENSDGGGTATPSAAGTFSFLLRSVAATTTVYTTSIDKAGNRALSKPLVISEPLRLLGIKMPLLAGKMLEVCGGANHVLGTISGKLMYDTGSVPLSMVVDNNGMTWAGSVSITANVYSVGTLAIFAADIYNQPATFIGTLSIDTIPPSAPIIVATYTTRAGWVIYGTATDAVIVELLVNNQLSGTTTLSTDGTFTFTLGIVTGSTSVQAKSINKAGNRAFSEPLIISPQVVTKGAPVSLATAALVLSNDGGTITISGKNGQTTLMIPPDALAEDSQITITMIAKTTGKLAIANFNAKCEKNMTPLPDSHISISACQTNGKPVSATQAMKLCIPYNDDNHDGIIDETNICVETLKIFKLNETSNRWDMIVDSYPVNARCEVWANINEFGIYAVMSYEQICSLSDVQVYPNPFYPNMNQQCKFSPLPSGRLTIYIYNSAGEQVRILRNGNEWNGNNDHEDPVASGIYFYLIKNAEGKTTGKIGLIR